MILDPQKASFEASNFPCSKWLGKDASSALPERAEERKTSRGSDKSGLFYTSCSFWWSRDVVFWHFATCPWCQKKKILLFLTVCNTLCDLCLSCGSMKNWQFDVHVARWPGFTHQKKNTKGNLEATNFTLYIEWWMVVFALNRNFSFGKPYELGFKWL